MGIVYNTELLAYKIHVGHDTPVVYLIFRGVPSISGPPGHGDVGNECADVLPGVPSWPRYRPLRFY